MGRGKKNVSGRQEDRTIVFVDESGFYLLLFVSRTYDQIGSTPIIGDFPTSDHLSAISGITADGELSMMVQSKVFRSPDVVKFLRHLLRYVGEKLLVIFDGSPIHRSYAIKDFLASEAAGRIHPERFPPYGPELNPDEGIWNYLKRVELKNFACRDLHELGYELRKPKVRLRHKRDVISICIERVALY